MRLIDVKGEVIYDVDNIESTIKIIAKFEDKAKYFPFEIVLTDCLSVSSDKVFDELKRVESEHPFFKLSLCESPIELKFFVYSLKKNS